MGLYLYLMTFFPKFAASY